MSKPDHVPQDVWEAAEHALNDQLLAGLTQKQTIAFAILDERERCAKVARNFFPPAHTYASENADIYHAQDSAAAAIANAINPSASGGPSAPRGASISPAPLGAQNENFAKVPHEGIVR